jgi:hypothetical protein
MSTLNSKLLLKFFFLQKIFNLNSFKTSTIDFKTFYKKKKIYKYKKSFKFIIFFFSKILYRLIMLLLYKFINLL